MTHRGWGTGKCTARKLFVSMFGLAAVFRGSWQFQSRGTSVREGWEQLLRGEWLVPGDVPGPARSKHGVSGWRLEPSESAHPSPQRINYRVYSSVTHSFQLAS